MMRWAGWLMVIVVAAGGCGDDDDGQNDEASIKAAAESCHGLCEVQSRPPCDPAGNPPVATCKQLCDALARDVKPDCRDEFSAFYTCSSEHGVCSGSIVPDACTEALNQRVACEGTGGGMCVGAIDGFCPSVQCPCPTGVTPVSGFTRESGECRCYDEQTCVELCD